MILTLRNEIIYIVLFSENLYKGINFYIFILYLQACLICILLLITFFSEFSVFGIFSIIDCTSST